MKPILIPILAAALALPAAAEPKRIYIANDDHTDYMWTADADTFADVFVDMLDWHLNLADETAHNPPAYRNRFNCDGSYWLWTYEQKKSPAEFEKLIGRVKDGSISAPLNTLVSCYGGMPAEAVLRSMYYSGRLERKHDMRFEMATAMENQVLPLGLTSLFAGAGAKYSWRGVCGCASRLDNKVLGERKREVYRWTGQDGQSLLMKWYSLQRFGIGGYWEAGSPLDAINHVTENADFLRRYRDPVTNEPYQVIGLFGFGGDDLARKTGIPPAAEIPAVPGLQKVISSPRSEHFHEIAREQSNPQRQVIVSNELDFFEDFNKTHGANLESETVTYGNEWDLYSASMSETSARAKRAVEKLRPAEFLAAMVSLKYPAFMNNHQAARDRAFNGMGLFWEHNWTADGPVSRPHRAAWQEEIVAGIEGYANAIQGEGIVRLGGMIPRPENANRFFVLNPLGWPRTDAADFPYSGAADIHVRDLSTNADVPHQIVKLSGVRNLRILASDIPSAGYKVFEIQPGKGTAATDEAATTGGDGSFLENSAVKLVIERDGAIRSLIDKRRGNTELAAEIFDLKLNDFAAKSDEGEALRVINRGPVSVTVRALSEAGVPHDTFITLYRDSDRVDIRNEITENFSDVRYWAFSFGIKDPSVHTEEVGAVILNKPKADGGHYADSHARYDHVTVNHFADISAGDGKSGVTLSNPDLAFAKLGGSEVKTLDWGTPQINMLAGGQVDGAYLGIRGQNGNTRFLQRFALRAHDGYQQAAAMKFALEHQNPFVTGAVISKQGGVYPETRFSLLGIDNPDVLLWALKSHEDGIGNGLVARVWNQSQSPQPARFTLAEPLSAARRLTHIETPIENLPVRDGALEAAIGAQRMETFQLKITPP
ncbi:glycoside hydrolase [bacterium]|nr:glycoside hydrolase [bacterium]